MATTCYGVIANQPAGWCGNPLTQPATITVDAEKAQTWIKNGAQPTDTVRGLLKNAGVL